jgi:hypothetical protein
MTTEPKNHTLALLREMRAEMREGFAELKNEIASVREFAVAQDAENAKILEKILQDTSNIKDVLVDLQARVVRNERRVAALEEGRPQA